MGYREIAHRLNISVGTAYKASTASMLGIYPRQYIFHYILRCKNHAIAKLRASFVLGTAASSDTRLSVVVKVIKYRQMP